MPKKKADESKPLGPPMRDWYCQNDGYKLPKQQGTDPGPQTNCPKHDGAGWWAIEPPPAGGWEKWEGALASKATRIPVDRIENATQRKAKGKGK